MIRRVLALFFLAHAGCIAAEYGDLPLPFESYGSAGSYVSQAFGFSALISREGAIFALSGKPGSVMRMRILGGNPQAQAEGETPLGSWANYLTGKDPAGWRTNVPQFRRVRIREILPHIDMVYYGSDKRLEYDLVLRPGADVTKVRMKFEGEGVKPEIDGAGDLVLKTPAGEIVEHCPRVEQNGTSVQAGYRIDANGEIRIELGAYDRTRDLRIDPVISYLTYLGGTADDSPNAIAVDAAGNAYIAGSTSSFTFPVTPGALQTAFPPTFETVAFVTKLNAAGTGLVYTTFLGGSGINGGDAANGIAVDTAGNVYLSGTTGSTNFPVTVGALSTALSGATDAFVAKLNPSGTALLYSTYLGGSGQEAAYGIAVDASGGAYITGSTSSTNFPVTTGVPQSALKSANDAFVVKLNPTGKTLAYGTYLGGSAEDDAYGIAVDSAGNAYVTGSTASTDFPVTATAFQKALGPAAAAFATKVNAAGTAFSYSTFLGGTGGDAGNAIAVDGSGNSYIAGTTFSADFPVSTGVVGTAVPGVPSHGHAFVTKVSSTGGLAYSTYLGGSNGDGANGVALDAAGDAIVTGFTHSTNFPASANPADPVANFNPAAFLTKLNPGATAVAYSTLLGASGSTVGQAVAMDASNHAFVTGYTGSLTLPVSTGAFQAVNATLSPQASTGFVAKVDLGSAVSCTLSFSPASVNLPVAGGPATVSVIAPAGCGWEAIPGSSWMTVSLPASGIGPGTVSVTAGSNAMSLSGRSGAVNAGSAGLTVTQTAGSCSAPQFYPASQTFGPAGGTGSVAVGIPPGCAVTATSSASWITINSGANATGDDLVTFTVAALAGNARSGAITIDGIAYTIGQTGSSCATSLTPSGSSVAAAGGSLTAALVATVGCAWAASSSAGWLTVSPASGTGSATLTMTGATNTTGAARNATVSAAGFSFGVTQAAASGRINLTVFRSAGDTWYVNPANGQPVAQQWGIPGDLPEVGDFDGDGILDFAVWRPSTAQWFIIPSATPASYRLTQWGFSTDIAVPGDYDGDGKTDIAVWRPSNGTWFIVPSTNPTTPIVRQWGLTGDIPVVGDFDGDGKADFAVWRPSNGTWYIAPSSNPSSTITKQWGLPGDVPVAADYDGDLKTDVAVFRPSSSIWYIQPSSAPGNPVVQQWGLPNDIVVPQDYDRDGKVDIAVWRPASGTWFILPTTTPGQLMQVQWGLSGDTPIFQPTAR